MSERPVTRWAVEWRSESRVSGKQRYFLWAYAVPRLFRTREAARQWNEVEHGYIRRRHDLQREPHGWHMPRVVKVQVLLRAAR